MKAAPLPLVAAMLSTARESAADLAARVGNVRPLPYGGTGPERFAFTLDGKPHVGALRGRNRNALLGFGDAADRAIAVRAMLDGDAEPAKGGTL